MTQTLFHYFQRTIKPSRSVLGRAIAYVRFSYSILPRFFNALHYQLIFKHLSVCAKGFSGILYAHTVGVSWRGGKELRDDGLPDPH